jgi:hypothetical protein
MIALLSKSSAVPFQSTPRLACRRFYNPDIVVTPARKGQQCFDYLSIEAGLPG